MTGDDRSPAGEGGPTDPTADELGFEVDWHPDGSEFWDRCFACGRDTLPWKIVRARTMDDEELTRSFHSCPAEHESVTHADWWVDWKGWVGSESEVIGRIQVFFPSKGDGGTTWSGAPL